MQIIEWWDTDEDVDVDDDSTQQEYVMYAFGVDMDTGATVSCKIENFKPYYYIKVDGLSQRVIANLMSTFQTSYPLSKFDSPVYRYALVKAKSLYGFENGEVHTFAKVYFNSKEARRVSRFFFKQPVKIEGKFVKLKLYESNFDPFMRYCHIHDIKMAGVVEISNYSRGYFARTAESIIVDCGSITPVASNSIGRLLQASFDIEVYSHNREFPDPKHAANVVYQIATTFKYYGDDDIYAIHLFTLRDSAPITGDKVIVTYVPSEKELISAWVSLIERMDPDVLYTYNGDSFDFRYLHVRGGALLDRLSRLKSVNSSLVKEDFNSSARGDNEFYRMYIPGRLNYDLLVHYKNGLKNYVNYKLNTIAEAVLGDKKHNVSAKQIFDYYDSGDPVLIRTIGEYCIQDTALLQRLVDRQNILTGIIQLANITYIPVRYNVTKGQTVKVMSQILRKARSMGILVPNTNFNKDNVKLEVSGSLPRAGEYYFFKYDSFKKFFVYYLGHGSALADAEPPDNRAHTMYNVVGAQVGECKFATVVERVEKSFVGATVLDPICGYYSDSQICVQDFCSLYPTVMMAFSLCFSTVVLDPKYLDLPGVRYETFEWDDMIAFEADWTCDARLKSGKCAGNVCGKKAYFLESGLHYCRIHDPLKKTRDPDADALKVKVHHKYVVVQPGENGENTGVIPSLLAELFAERKRVKREMNSTTSDITRGVLDAMQLAIKICLNSVYGFVSRDKGDLVMKPIGMMTTYLGRTLIKKTKDYAETKFADHVYNTGLLTHTLSTDVYRAVVDNLSPKQIDDALSQFIAAESP